MTMARKEPSDDRWKPDDKRTARLAHGVALSVIAKHLDGDDETAAMRHVFGVVDGRSWVDAFVDHVRSMERARRPVLAVMSRLAVLREIEEEAQVHVLQWLVASERNAQLPGEAEAS